MSTKRADLELAFDVGHSSIGWAVLQNHPQLEIKGCGAVIFRADDCLASTRRQYRRQRRHIRSTRQRIKRMKALLLHLGVLTQAQLDKPGCGWPWKLAARVLVGGKTLTWPELWDVLRWYAHNRGYDGNSRWSDGEAENDEDTKKEQIAVGQLAEFEKKHGRKGTMAEVFCDRLEINPTGDKRSSRRRFKDLGAAFPRKGVENEVRRILQAHFDKLRHVDGTLERALCGIDNKDKDAWRTIPWFTKPLPKRYEGGLLFGQLVPRFDNRIISKCPVTGLKVPSRNTREFLNFRWGMLLANVRVARLADRELNPLTVEERKELDKRMRAVGSMTEKQFKDTVRDVAGAIRGNFDTMFMEVNQKEALILDPVQDCLTSGHAAVLFPTLPEQIQKRTRGQLRRGKTIKLGDLGRVIPAFDAAVQKILDERAGKGKKKDKPLTREAILGETLSVKKLSGRAAYARPVLVKAFNEVMAGKHPKEGGCLFVTEKMREAQLNRSLAEQTNNHLVRHRLQILGRVLADIIKEYSAGDKTRIAQVTIEVNRDLQEFSGLDVQGKAKLQGLKLSNHKKVSEKLETTLRENNRLDAMSASLIRKARIADDLDCVCPYVGPKKPFELIDLVNKQVDLDHIIPKAERESDSLDSLVVTYSEINKWKGKRTAWQFVKDEQGKQVPGRPELSIQSLAHYEEFVKSLPPHRDPFKHQAGNGDRRFLDDDKRRWRRKKLLLLADYTEKTFTQKDLTQTSQITRLAQQMILKNLEHLAPHHVVHIPGSVTGTVRKAWDILGCLNLACPEATGKNKTEIRSITHLHHALDACVLGLTKRFIPNDGHVWELLGKRTLTPAECRELDVLGIFDFNNKGLFRLRDLDNGIKEQIRQRLAQKRVVQHIPKRMAGLRVEENTRGVVKIEDGRVHLRQQKRDEKTGKIKVNYTVEPVGKLLGLNPEKPHGLLRQISGARVIEDNFGVAILDHADDETHRFAIIPYHKVWHRLQKLKQHNKGKTPRLLRIGSLVEIPNRSRRSDYRGIWMIRGAQLNQRQGVLVDLSHPDTIEYRVAGRDDCYQNVRLQSLYEGGIKILTTQLTGVSSCPTTSSA